MTTALDLANLCLFDAGVVGTGQAASGQDSALFLTRLNFLLAQWQDERWLVYHTVDTSKLATGAQSYTVGPGGDFNVTAAPDRLEAAFIRQTVQSQPNQIDYPVEVLQAREDYNRIALKKMQSFPEVVFLDSDFPLGVVYFWPVPQAAIYEMHLTLKAILSQVANLAATLNLPLVYFNALHYNMVVRLRSAYDLPVKPMDVQLAKASLNAMRKANTQIARLQMPKALVRPGVYNVYSDQIR
jgi:hypothetical protein